MFRLTSSLHSSGRTRTILAASLALAAFLAIAAWSTSAQASGCTNTFTNTAGGSWFTASNWSKGKVPTSTEEACITENGTYTVEMTQTSTTGTVSVKALTIGGTSGTQTLAVGSSGSLNAVLTTSEGLATGTHGAATMTNGDGSGNSVTLVGPITNAGTLTTVPAAGGNRSIQGNLTNTGTLQINTNTEFDAEAGKTLTNEGALDLAEAKTLNVSSKCAVVNATGGKIAGTGTGNIFVKGAGTSFTEGAGTTSGTQPVIVDDSALSYTGAGESFIKIRGTSTLSGSLGSAQSLSIESTGSENAQLTAAASFTNAGSITETNGDGSGNSETLILTSPSTLTNSGTITTQQANGGGRTIQGNVKNTGTIQINASTEYNGESATLTNGGAIDLATERTLKVSNKGAVVNGAGASINGTGTGTLLLASGTSFTEGAGTTTGTQPVIVDDATLSYTGGGESFIKLRGTSTLSGTSVVGQSLSIESTGSENAIVTASPSFTNGGSIKLTNGDGSGNSETLAGTIANSGTITTELANGGARTFSGSITNTGTIQINQNTSDNTAGTTLLNEGAIDIANGVSLSVPSKEETVVNAKGGTIAGTGSGALVQTGGGTFEQGAGTTSGTQPVIEDDGTLDYTGAGASFIKLRGTSTLKGTTVSGQSLSIESTGSENAIVTANPSFTNGGSVTLTNGDGSGNNATLAGPLTNSGTITTEQANGGNRTLAGSLKNTGTLQINANTESDGEKATLTNEGAINLATGKTLRVTNSGAVINGTGASINAGSGTGDLLVERTETSFTEGAGTTAGSQPVILDDTALKYTGSGSSFIKIRGSSTLSGNIGSAQSLSIESTGSENATVTAAASFTNAGTITQTNGDGSGNSETLLVTSPSTLTNSGTIATEVGVGGSRTIQGNLTNTGALKLNRSTEYDAAATTLLNEGIIEIATGEVLTVNNKDTVINETGGDIVASGTGALVQSAGGTFEQGAGKTTGTQPVVLDDLALKYTNKGASTLALRGASTLSGTISAGQTLSLQSTGSENANISAASFTNNGKLVLTNGDGSGNNVTLSLAGGTLTNSAKKGVIEAEVAHGGGRTIEGSLVNEGTVGTSATLKVTGSFTELGKKPVFKTTVSSSGTFGVLAVTGPASILGELSITQAKPTFVPSVGEKFGILSSSALTGTFSKLKGNKIKKSAAKMYTPIYSATAVTLEAQA